MFDINEEVISKKQLKSMRANQSRHTLIEITIFGICAVLAGIGGVYLVLTQDKSFIPSPIDLKILVTLFTAVVSTAFGCFMAAPISKALTFWMPSHDELDLNDMTDTVRLKRFLELCQTYPEVDEYRLSVVSANRSLVHQDYLAATAFEKAFKDNNVSFTKSRARQSEAYTLGSS